MNDIRQKRFDNFIFYICCVLVAGRCQINETFPLPGQITNVDIGIAEVPSMLFFAGVILTLCAAWVINRFWNRTFSWRKTSLEVPLLGITAAGIVSTCFASNKHLATIGAVNWLSLFLLAMLLVQLLDTPRRRLILILVIVATGITAAYHCLEQYYVDIPNTISDIKAHPEEALRRMGLEPGTYEAQQYLDRVMSGDVGGFFAISNTAASFFILSIAATIGLVSLSFSSGRDKQERLAQGTGGLLLVLFQVWALSITDSKGGIAACLAGGLLMLMLWLGRGWLGRHWKKTLIIAAGLLVLAAAGIVYYGTTHGRLPSDSLWVRWQYWEASWPVIAHSWLTGVGPENFGRWYPRFMNPAAPEVVKDPHCFLLSIFSQWGIVGFVATLWVLVAVTVRLARPDDASAPPGKETKPVGNGTTYKHLLPGVLFGLAVLIIRLAVSELPQADAAVWISVLFISFLMPMFIWFIGYMLGVFLVQRCFTGGIRRGRGGLLIALAGGLAGFLLHNCIDFAIFQPGVGTLFFALIALGLSLKHNPPVRMKSIKPVYRRTAIVAAALLLLGYWFGYGLPVSRSQRALQQARAAAMDRQLERAELKLTKGARLDPLNPDPYFHQALLLMQTSLPCRSEQDCEALRRAVDNLEIAIDKDPAAFKYHEKLAMIYEAFAEYHQEDEWLSLARDEWTTARAMYPSNARILFHYARLHRQMGSADEALAAYRKIIEFEQAFQRQHEQLFPDYTGIRQRTRNEILSAAQNAIKEMTDTP